MIIPPLFEFGNLTVADAGIAGNERIVVRPTESVNLAQYAIILGWRDANGITIPLDYYLFWAGDMIVKPPCWIVVYTGRGQPKCEAQNGQSVYFFYWGRESTVFNCRESIPLLVKFAGIQFGTHLNQLPTFEELMAKAKGLASPNA